MDMAFHVEVDIMRVQYMGFHVLLHGNVSDGGETLDITHIQWSAFQKL